MTGLAPLVAALALCAGCYPEQPSQYSTFPQPTEVQGPPGGEMDPQMDPQQPQQGYGDPAMAAAPDGVAPGQDGQVDPNAVATDPNAGTGPVTDGEIDQTLDGYGSWTEDPDYGRVWRPDATVVGADFTPYETCGTWVWTDYGWSFQCDYDWGWLPFHYGRWAWLDDGGYWGWVPGYDWSPAWVDWRDGGGYVGWRPMGPGVHVRDHRHPDHPSHWRFASYGDFARPHVRSHLFKDPAEGLRVTNPVGHPSGVHPTTPPVHVATIMHPRLANPKFTQGFGRTTPSVRTPSQAYHPPVQSYPAYRQPVKSYPTYRPPVQSYPAYRQPTPSYGYRQPAQSYPTYRQPVQSYPTYRPPVQNYPTYRPPMQSYHPSAPSQSWSPPSHSSWSPPSHSSSPSYSHSSSPSYSHSSSSSSSYSHSSSSSSSSSSSHSSGGGGHHR